MDEQKAWCLLQLNDFLGDRWIMSSRKITKSECHKAFDKMSYSVDLNELGFGYSYCTNQAVSTMFLPGTSKSDAQSILQKLNSGKVSPFDLFNCDDDSTAVRQAPDEE